MALLFVKGSQEHLFPPYTHQSSYVTKKTIRVLKSMVERWNVAEMCHLLRLKIECEMRFVSWLEGQGHVFPPPIFLIDAIRTPLCLLIQLLFPSADTHYFKSPELKGCTHTYRICRYIAHLCYKDMHISSLSQNSKTVYEIYRISALNINSFVLL